jgi:hypothetical protein
VGLNHACALGSTGSVVCWGANYRGQLGDGAVSDDRGTPTKLHSVVGLRDVVQVASMEETTCARRRNGRIACWGWGARGGLGDGNFEARYEPGLVPRIHSATDLAGGGDSACAVHGWGQVSCWGYVSGYYPLDESIELPPGQDGKPRLVTGLKGVLNIDAAAVGCAVLRQGGVWCWNANPEMAGHPLLGRGQNANASMPPAPIVTTDEVAKLGAYVQVACNNELCCALHASGLVSCHGETGAVIPVGPNEPGGERLLSSVPMPVPDFKLLMPTSSAAPKPKPSSMSPPAL